MRNGILKALAAFCLVVGMAAPSVAPAQPPAAEGCQPVAPAIVADCWRAASASDGPATRAWFSGEYLLWWLRDARVPPLVTTSPAGTEPAIAGVLGPSSTVLSGGSATEQGAFSGARFTAGLWLDDDATLGVEAGGLFLCRQTKRLGAASDAAGNPILARPVLDVLTPAETAEAVAFPDAFAGAVAVSSSTDLWGTEVNLLARSFRGSAAGIAVLAGFRYLNLEERLTISQGTTVLEEGVTGFNGAFLFEGNREAIVDQFGTRNQFYGGQVGLRGSLPWGPLSLDWVGQTALGVTHQSADVQGSTALLPAGGGTPQAASGGVLALPTNIGHHHRDEFGVVCRVGVKLRYCLTESLSVGVGYDFLWWNEVVRPGDQIDRAVDPRQVPSSLQFAAGVAATRPAFAFHQSDFWAQGLAFEVGVRY